MRISLTPYSSIWPQHFENEKAVLLQQISVPIRIEHIGSTAVPGLCAKPIIDIMIGVTALEHLDLAVPAITQLGYEYLPHLEDAMPERRFFRKWNGAERTHHIHLVQEKSTFWNRHLAFRDYLRVHDEVATQYGDLKRALAAQDWGDMNDYADAKTDFIRNVEARALAQMS